MEPVQEVTDGGGGGSLPYTGFPTIPVMLIGLGLLGAGAAVRMRIRADEQSLSATPQEKRQKGRLADLASLSHSWGP